MTIPDEVGMIELQAVRNVEWINVKCENEGMWNESM
jgi:hypothetical protein